VQRLLVDAARAPAGLGEQFVALRFHRAQQLVAAAGGYFAERFVERATQVVGGVADRFAQLLRRALLYPQQTGDTPVLGLARAAPGVLVAEQFGQAVLGLLAVQALAAD